MGGIFGEPCWQGCGGWLGDGARWGEFGVSRGGMLTGWAKVKVEIKPISLPATTFSSPLQ